MLPPTQPLPLTPGELRLPVGVGDDAVLHGGGPAQRHQEQRAPPAERGRPGQPAAGPEGDDEALCEWAQHRGTGRNRALRGAGLVPDQQQGRGWELGVPTGRKIGAGARWGCLGRGRVWCCTAQTP